MIRSIQGRPVAHGFDGGAMAGRGGADVFAQRLRRSH